MKLNHYRDRLIVIRVPVPEVVEMDRLLWELVLMKEKAQEPNAQTEILQLFSLFSLIKKYSIRIRFFLYS